MPGTPVGNLQTLAAHPHSPRNLGSPAPTKAATVAEEKLETGSNTKIEESLQRLEQRTEFLLENQLLKDPYIL